MCSNITNEKIREQPLISCVMPTYGRPDFVNEAIAMFLAQDYPHKELVVLNDCPAQKFHGDLPSVRVFNSGQRYPTLGEKRNAAIQLAQGDVMAIWDDDDIYLPWRLSFSWQQMQRLAIDFYRPAEFWAYWGEENLHDNQVAPGWVSHALVMFTKSLWRNVGGYPPQNLGEDAVFFRRIQDALDQAFSDQAINRQDRFFILRGKSKYQHMSIHGGERSLDLTPGRYELKPSPIADIVLRQHIDQLVETRRLLLSS